MSEELTIKQFDGSNIFFMEDGWFNATTAAKKFGKDVNDWLRSDEALNYGIVLAKSLNLLNSGPGGVNEMLHDLEISCNRNARRNLITKFLTDVGLIKTKRGSSENGGGTWLHPKLAIQFARWLSIEFQIWCDDQITALLRFYHAEVSPPIIRPDFPVIMNQQFGFEMVGQDEDEYCKENRLSFDLIIKKQCGLRNPRYIQELTNLVYSTLADFTANDFRRGWGILPGSRVRTRLFMDAVLRRAVDMVESIVYRSISMNRVTQYSTIYHVVRNAAQSVRSYHDANLIILGRSVRAELSVDS